MDHSKKLKTYAVVSAEINRKSGGSREANQASSGVVPFGIGDLCGRHLPLGDFARRKYGEHTALLQPSQCLTQRAAIRFRRAVGLKRIDEDAMILKLGYITEQEIREHFHVWTDTGKENSEQCAIKNTIRMIRNHHDGTTSRDS